MAHTLQVEDSIPEVIEQRGIEPVPESERFGTEISQFRIWFGANAVVSALFVGFLGPVVFSLNVWSSLTAIFVGTLVAALAVGFLSTLGPRTGMVQILFSRFAFGYAVGRILGFFNAIYCYAWSAVNLVTGTAAVQLAFVLMGIKPLGTGTGSYVLWVLILAAITTTVSVIGYNLVHRWELVSTYGSIVVFAVLTIAVLLHHPNAGSTAVTGSTYVKNWLSMALAAFGFGVGWIPYVSDYSRKLPRTVSYRAVWMYATLGLVLSATWVETVGALLSTTAFKAVTSGSNTVVNGIPAILGNNGLVILGLLIVGLSTVSNNIPNDYTGGLSIQAAGIHVHRWIVTFIGGVLSALGAIFFLQNFANRLQAFLLLLSYWVGAWFVLVVYNYFKRGGRYNVNDWDNGRGLPNGVSSTIAFVVALYAAWLGMIPTIPQVAYNILGQSLLGNKVGVDLGFILAIVTALVVRIILDMIPATAERTGRA